MKAFTRCGMGPCQGRLCGLTVTEMIAEARGVSPAEIGYYRLRPPVKPVTLAEIAALPQRLTPEGRCAVSGSAAATADVVIIGGGIHGCSTALHCRLRGLSVILIEKDHAGRHASGVNAGGVRQLARDIAEIPLSVHSMDIWHRIEEVVDDDCGFTNEGQVLVAETEAELALFKERVDDLRARGFTHENDRRGLKLTFGSVPAVSKTSGRRRLAPRQRRDPSALSAEAASAARRKRSGAKQS